MRSLPSLDEFLDPNHRSRNSHLQEPEWRTLYVRKGKRFINSVWSDPVIDLATLAARKPGRGAFARLIERLRTDYPTWGIYIENVLEEWFREKIRWTGFSEVDFENHCFFSHGKPSVVYDEGPIA